MEIRKRPPIWLLISLAWIGPAILAVFQRYMQGRLRDSSITWRDIVWEGADWLFYAVLTPGVFALSRSFPLSRGALSRHLPLHLVSSVAFCAAWAVGGVLMSLLLRGTHPYGNNTIEWFLISLPFGVPVYFAVLGVEHAARYFVEARERETVAARLEAQLADARLGALRMQFQPHFLLNSLNAVSVIVRDRDTVTATRILDHLGAMLRRVMRSDRPPEVPLSEELEFVRQYLAVEEIRFPDRLRPAFDVDESLMDALVPEFILQPLVENAIRHGLSRRMEATLLRIQARRENESVILSVTDDGPGPSSAIESSGAGVGLTNTRERLRTMYGNAANLTLASTPRGGAVAEIRLPLKLRGEHRG